jgi:hypothetical protein
MSPENPASINSAPTVRAKASLWARDEKGSLRLAITRERTRFARYSQKSRIERVEPDENFCGRRATRKPLLTLPLLFRVDGRTQSSTLAKDPLKDHIDVFQMIAEIKQLFEVGIA